MNTSKWGGGTGFHFMSSGYLNNRMAWLLVDTVELIKEEFITHFSSFLKQFHYVAQAGLELLIFLSAPVVGNDLKLLGRNLSLLSFWPFLLLLLPSFCSFGSFNVCFLPDPIIWLFSFFIFDENQKTNNALIDKARHAVRTSSIPMAETGRSHF